jgi:hypothetical protein
MRSGPVTALGLGARDGGGGGSWWEIRIVERSDTQGRPVGVSIVWISPLGWTACCQCSAWEIFVVESVGVWIVEIIVKSLRRGMIRGI